MAIVKFAVSSNVSYNILGRSESITHFICVIPLSFDLVLLVFFFFNSNNVFLSSSQHPTIMVLIFKRFYSRKIIFSVFSEGESQLSNLVFKNVLESQFS